MLMRQLQSVQRDQLSIAKTCIHLLEIAYPVAYHRIFIKTDPVTAMTTWKNLASGNGLRHVRHLQVHDSGQSTANARKRHHVGDVVTGILLAAMRRHQLLSFSLTHPIVVPSMVSTRNSIILMETQQHLAQVSLPSFMRSNNISIADYLPVTLQFRSLRHITLELPISSSVDYMSSVIGKKSPSLKSIHLWFSAQGNELSPHVFTAPRGEPSSRSILFSMATRLTILGYDFKYLPTRVGLPSFPALHALAMIDCKNDVHFHVRIKPECLPKLRALLITSANYIRGDDIIRLIGGTSCLRELIVYGPNLYFMNYSSLRSHAQSLELLFFGIRGTSISSLSALTALRHLGVSMDDLYCLKSNGFCIESKKRLTKVFADFASHKKLLSLTL
ncbi:hypothetical protein GT037_004016 [Alternaria burnsii]|uniref:Uncharacterized protein n=1 Tax=Alternaria burnsii TaxID=1187904 RepID=A0A8H7EG53_9PLEO|nr:uncharacterized protein GT037_004016 [Alternaria burnsii]KAF7678635.1 hypothetical protein GT037_004016 [Alternaria burnsii]